MLSLCPSSRASAYQKLLDVQTGDFSTDITEISFNEIPTLDRDSANYLGDRQMGTLSDMVSQFEYSNDSTQINYQGRPVRVAPSTTPTSSSGSPTGMRACLLTVLVDMVTQEAKVVRLDEGMSTPNRTAEPEHLPAPAL